MTGTTPAQTALSYNFFQSQLYPYSLEYPKSWGARPSGVQVGDARGDEFVASQGDPQTALVTVFSEQVSSGSSTSQYVLKSLDEVRATGGEDVQQVGTASVDGQQAALVRWMTLSVPEQRRQVDQAIWVADGRAWVVTLTAPQQSAAQYQPVFQHMLQTFRVR